MDITIISIYNFNTMGRQAYLQLVLYRVPDFHHTFFIQRFKNGKVDLSLCTKNWLSRAFGYQNYLYLYVYTTGEQAYVRFCFVMMV